MDILDADSTIGKSTIFIFCFLLFGVGGEREEGESTQIHGYNHKSDSSPLECPHFLWIVHIKLLLQTWHLNFS